MTEDTPIPIHRLHTPAILTLKGGQTMTAYTHLVWGYYMSISTFFCKIQKFNINIQMLLKHSTENENH